MDKFLYILGPAGSGKSCEMISHILASLRNGKRVFLIVPEQEVMIAEKRVVQAADDSDPKVSCEELNVVSFRRLANLVFRKYSGLRYVSPSEGAKLLLMWQLTEELMPNFSMREIEKDRSFSELMLSACDELKRNAVTPAMLETAEKKLAEDDPLRDKLHDLALIYSGYQFMMSGNYTDPSDDVTRMFEILKKNNFFEGSDVYLDSFSGFTMAELNVISMILRQANELFVTLCLPNPIPNTGFETVQRTVKQLKALCENASVKDIREIRLERSDKYYSKELIELEKIVRMNFYNEDNLIQLTERVEKDEYKVLPVRSDDEFSEVEFAAVRILDLVRKGARYRDIAIVTRGIDRLFGIIDPTLKKFDIPYFMSVRKAISSTPLFHAVTNALTVIDGGWKSADIMALLKVGEIKIDTDELDLLEKYTTLWAINGKSWKSDREWTMNPDGYSDKLTAEGCEELERVNRIRDRIREPLLCFEDAFLDASREKVTLEDGCRAIYEFLVNIGLRERTEFSKNDEAVTLYNTFMDMLDMLVRLGSDIPVNARTLKGILEMVADKTDFGSIPEVADCVMIGDAALLRAGSVKHVIMLECIDGVFPRAVADDSFFSDIEKNKLTELGISSSPSTDVMADDEQFYFYRAVSAASETLAMVCPLQSKGEKCEPSFGFRLVQNAAIGAENEIVYPNDFSAEFRAVSNEILVRILRGKISDKDKFAIIRAAGAELERRGFFRGDKLTESEASISAETAERIFGKDIALTQYRLESFVKCKFSYYCKYILGLSEPKQASFTAADEGNFIHRVLEKAVGELFDDNGLRKDIELLNIDEWLSDLTDEILRGMLGEEENGEIVFTARLSVLIERLRKRTALLLRSLIEEFSNSKFRPSYFELNIGNDGIEPLKVALSDGSSIYVYGKIDRVDTFKKGNDVMVRVVDYKSGSTEHSLKRIEKGLDLQLLLYMFAVWHTDRKRLSGPLGLEENSISGQPWGNAKDEGSIIPAGVIYQSAAFPSISKDDPPLSDEEAIALGIKKFERNGFILDDRETLEAMDESFSGNFVPIKRDNDGVITAVKGSELKTLEGFGTLLEQVSDILKEVGLSMRSGWASAEPMKSEVPCKYCEFASFCRNKQPI